MIEFLKMLAEFVIPIGTETIVAGITSNAVKNEGGLVKIAAGISSLVIGWWIGDKAVDYLDEQLDEMQAKWEEYKLKGADE